MNTKVKSCSICKGPGHNKQTCPNKKIDDISSRKMTEGETRGETSEEIDIEEERVHLLQHLKRAQDYKIDPDITYYWLSIGRPCNLNQIRLGMDQGLTKDYLQLFIRCTKELDMYS